MLPLHVQADDPIYTLYVDGAPPTAQMSPFYEYNGSISRIDDASWKIQLAGSLSDPNLSGTGVVGSGVVTNTVLVQLLDNAGGVSEGLPQLAAVNGTNWTIDYIMNGLTPHGTYTVAVMLEDAAGNWAMADAGRKHMNERGPNVDLNQWALPLVISQSLTLSGTASILPEWGSGVVEHHFEELAGATQFYNTANSQFYTLTHSICTACPRPGRSAYLILASSSMAWMMQLRFPMSLRQR